MNTLQIAGDAVTVSDAAGPAGGVNLQKQTQEITSLALHIPAIAASAGLGSTNLRYNVQFHFNVRCVGHWSGGNATPSSSSITGRIFSSPTVNGSETNVRSEVVCSADGGAMLLVTGFLE